MGDAHALSMCFPRSVQPVSYTHLDVYKRQAYDKDRAALGQTLALLREGFAQVALGRETDARFSNRVSPGQAVAAAQIVQTARLRAERNTGVPLLCACMVEQIKSTLG